MILRAQLTKDTTMQMQEATDNITMQQIYTKYIDVILESGYNKPASIDLKEELALAVKLHFILFRNKAVLDQLKSGLLQLGVLAAIVKHSQPFRLIFVFDERAPLTAGKVRQ